MGVQRRLVSMWVRGENVPRNIFVMSRLVSALETPVDEIYPVLKLDR